MRNRIHCIALVVGIVMTLTTSARAQAQLPGTVIARPFFTTGVGPAGMDIGIVTLIQQKPLGGSQESFMPTAVVANSGGNSVSVVEVPGIPGNPPSPSSIATLSGIPSPYGVAACGSFALVSSPTDNSIREITMSFPLSGSSVGAAIHTGLQPYAVFCSNFSGLYAVGLGLVSNYGESTLSVIYPGPSPDLAATISGVPGAKAFHGIAVSQNSNIAWVAGTDANVLTEVDLTHLQVVAQVPVPHPTAVFLDPSGNIYVASGSGNTITVFSNATGQLKQTVQFQMPSSFQDVVSSTVFNPDVVGVPVPNYLAIDSQGALWGLNFNANPIATGPFATIPGAAEMATDGGLVTSTTTNSVYSIQKGPGTPSQFSASNGASFARSPLAPGTLASAFALAGVSQNFNAASVPLPKTLGGVTLSIGGSFTYNSSTGTYSYSSTGGLQAPLLFVGPNQINFQIPPGIAPSSAVAAQLTMPDGTTLLSTLNITATAPGIFTVLQNGQGQAAALNQDNSPNGPSSIVGANPAKLGSVIQIFATGGGETRPSLAPGDAAPASGNPLILTNAQPTVTIGGQPATVQFSGMAPGYVGLWQINAQIPQTVTPGNAVPLVVSAGGVTSNAVTIAVQ